MILISVQYVNHVNEYASRDQPLQLRPTPGEFYLPFPISECAHACALDPPFILTALDGLVAMDFGGLNAVITSPNAREVPQFHPGLEFLSSVTQVGKHGALARASDLHSIRQDIANYLPEVTVNVNNVNHVVKPLTKKAFREGSSTNIGFNSECTARLLVGIDRRNAFDKNPKRYAYMF